MDGASFFKTLLQSNSSNAPIHFNGSDETNSFPVSGQDVDIITSDGSHDLGSSKLKIKNIVNFGWDHKYYPGQVVAVHVTGTYLAYAITTPGKNLGVVRVVNRQTDDRILVKGMRGPVLDLAFAHIATEVIVGCVDCLGNMFVHRVTEQNSGLSSERLLEIVREDCEPGMQHRLIWCPFLPDPSGDDDDDDEEDEDVSDTSAARLLVLTHGPSAEIWSLDLAVEAHGSGPLTPEDVTQGLLQVTATSGGSIIDAAFSPDGSALATASEDGEIKFFQVYLHEDGPPRCLHQWSPHNGSPVSSLFFLDDHSNYQPDVQLWKFAVTGCKLNSEMKVWSCESWTCLQTLKINRPQGDETPVRLKSALDPTARYMLLADIDTCLIYVLSLLQGEPGARVVSISEFATPSAFLSFCCVSAGRRQVKQTTEGVQVSGHEDEEEAAVTGKEKTVIRIYLVQPKSLQECSIIFEDAAKVGGSLKIDPDLSVSFQDQSFGSQELTMLTSVEEALSPMMPDSQSTPRGSSPPIPTHSLPPDTAGLPLPPLSLTTRPASNADQLAEAASKISLLSPEQFKPVSSMLKSEPVPEDTSSSSSSSGRSREVLQAVNCQDSPHDSECELVPQLECVGRNTVSESGNSSPSREVAHILSVDDQPYGDHTSPPVTPDRTFQEESLSPSPVLLKKFPTPPALPPLLPPKVPGEAGDYIKLVEVVSSLEKQLKEERVAQETAMARRDRKIEALLARDQGDLLSKRLEDIVTQKLDWGLKEQQARFEASRKEQNEALLLSLSSTLVSRLDQIVTGELQRNLQGVITRTLEGTLASLERDIEIKLRGVNAQVEVAVREVVAQSLNNPRNMETLGRSVCQAVSQSLHVAMNDSYRVAFNKQSQGFERSLHALLKQMGEAFTEGTREYQETIAKGIQEVTSGTKDGIDPQLQEIRESMIRLGQSVSGLARQMDTIKSNITGDEVRDIVRKELQSAMANSRELAVTPKPDVRSITMRQAIQGHIQAGQIETAFQAALSANDLQVVVFTCELLNTTQVFNSATCPLSQSVLLSLIQQLSVDLCDKTEVKHAYLHEALVNLDPNNPTTKTHIKAVLTGLDSSLRHYIQANPNSKMTRNMKLLVMACGTQMQ